MTEELERQIVIAYIYAPPHRDVQDGEFRWNNGFVFHVEGEAVKQEFVCFVSSVVHSFYQWVRNE